MNKHQTLMLKNYFKIAFRNLTKSKMHSFLNIAGLSVGMAVALLIGLWINDELSFDKYHGHYNQKSGMQNITNRAASKRTSSRS